MYANLPATSPPGPPPDVMTTPKRPAHAPHAHHEFHLGSSGGPFTPNSPNVSLLSSPFYARTVSSPLSTSSPFKQLGYPPGFNPHAHPAAGVYEQNAHQTIDWRGNLENSPSSIKSRLMELAPDPQSPAATGVGGANARLRHDSSKRGRPRADVINHLIIEGSSSPSSIKCPQCNRVFPREKSLQVGG